jgi:hypothetical protein
MAELREGWSEVRSRTWIWVIVAVFSLALLTAFGPWMTLGATISIERYDTRAVYGILASALGAGTIVGALIGFRWRPRFPMRTGMLLALPLPIALGCFGLGLPVALLLPVFVLTGPTGEALGAIEVLSVGSAIALAALAAALTSREVWNLRSTAAAASR